MLATATQSGSSSTMGAIDTIAARKQAKIKSASIEASGGLRGGLSTAQLLSGSIDADQANDQSTGRSGVVRVSSTDTASAGAYCPTSSDFYDPHHRQQQQMNSFKTDQQQKLSRANNSFHVKAKKFLTLSPGGLKPSASTSCLNLTALASQQDSAFASGIVATSSDDTANSPGLVPTRASLTHEWKKLKTPNKCRECNLLVYFNGRECSFCGFVAHKKCLHVLVIKCSGQQVLSASKKPHQKDRSQSSESLALSAGRHSQPNQYQQLFQQVTQSPNRKSRSQTIQPIFGQPVDTDSRQVVEFLRRFIYEIDTRGLNSKGIYRVSSIKSKVDRLCNYYDQNLSSLVDLSSFHPNIIANALKMYLRQLPEPLLTNELYHRFIEVAKNHSQSPLGPPTPPPPSPSALEAARHKKPHSFSFSPSSPTTSSSITTANSATPMSNNPAYDPLLIVELKEIVEQLPPINRELVAILMRHLRRVADMSRENQMSAKNLSIIFGPTLLSADNNKSLAIVDNIHQARVVELMITWADQIFPQYANYESSAVIELDLSALSNDTTNATTDSRHQSKASDAAGGSSRRISGPLDTQSQSNNRNIRRSKESATKCLIQDDDRNKNIYEISNAPQSLQTRRDLKELRRQFFTVPASVIPAQAVPAPHVPPIVPDISVTEVGTNGNNRQGEKTTDRKQDQQSARSNTPPGSVPVIMGGPHYCRTLTYHQKDNK